VHVSVSVCVPCCIWSLAALGSRRPGPPGSLTFELRCGPAPSNVARCRGANKQADLWRFVCWFNHSSCQWFGYIVTTSIIYLVMRSWCQWLWYIVISLQDLKRHGCVCFHPSCCFFSNCLRFLTTLWDQEFQDDIRCALEEQRHDLHYTLRIPEANMEHPMPHAIVSRTGWLWIYNYMLDSLHLYVTWCYLLPHNRWNGMGSRFYQNVSQLALW